MNRQQAVDMAKMYCRETGRTQYVVRTGHDEYAVLDRDELAKALADGRCERDAIMFSIQGEADEEPA
jgi:predicted RNA-binding protein associated with RNAse of E/G family